MTPVAVLRDWISNFSSQLGVRMPEDAWLAGRYVVAGAGGVGTWTTIMLALHAKIDSTEIHIFDDDKLELHNANRLPYPVYYFLQGTPKAVALRKHIEWIRPGLRVEDYIMSIDDDKITMKILSRINPDVVIDAVDSTASITTVRKIAAKIRKPVLSLHYDGWHGTVEWIPRPWEQEGGAWTLDNAAHYTTPSTALTPAALSIIGVLILLDWPDEPIIYTFELR